jgi:hypothetical protein
VPPTNTATTSSADGQAIEPSKEKFTPGAVHVHDFHATILHQLGIDHTRLTHTFQGRRFRLTDVHGHASNFSEMRALSGFNPSNGITPTRWNGCGRPDVST